MSDQFGRFWAKVDKRGPNDCWLWTAAKGPTGYGVFAWRPAWGDLTARTYAAHQIAFYLRNGWRPLRGSGLVICHSCANPACCNPRHLRADTPAANTSDMMAAGNSVRGRPEHGKRGEQHHGAKLTAAAIIAIRGELAAGASRPEVAARWKIALSSVGRIARGEAWKHLK